MVTPSTIQAGTVLEALGAGLWQGFADDVAPLLPLTRSLPPFSGSMLELHPGRAGCPFDWSCKATFEYDGPLLQPASLLATMPQLASDSIRHLTGPGSDSYLYGIENLYFEWDFPAGNGPALFFDLGRNTGARVGEQQADLCRLCESFYYPLKPEQTGFVKQLEIMGLRVVYFGLMLSRPHSPLRLTTSGIETEKLPGVLSALGWQGSQDQVKLLCSRYIDHACQVTLSFDAGKHPGPRIGIEVTDPLPAETISRLTGDGLLNEQEARWLHLWPGQTDLGTETAAALSALHQRPVSLLYRRLNHFKFILDKYLSAKAYLYYCF